MSGKKKTSPYKPAVPARPKNLVILNSKHLPKPPETFSSENITNFIKDLNLDVKDEENESGRKFKKHTGEGSDGEDSFGYLEPISLHPLVAGHEDTTKFEGVFQKVTNKNAASSLEIPELEETKLGAQWQRPLPSLPLPPVETKSVVATMPWYKNIDRKRGEEILKNGGNGYFLVRPSSNPDTYLTLTLWYGSRVYNIPIRRRKDGKFALGTPKMHEQIDKVPFKKPLLDVVSQKNEEYLMRLRKHLGSIKDIVILPLTFRLIHLMSSAFNLSPLSTPTMF